jgi:hypothetical protein
LSPLAFEATFGGPTLFDRLSERLRWRAAGRGCGTNIGAAALGGLAGVEPYGTGIDRRVCRGFLARCLSGSTKTALPSGITLELTESRQRANLARREAEMVLCHHPPESGDFYISKAGTFA